MFKLFIECYTKKYFQFRGRANRGELISFTLFFYLLIFMFGEVGALMKGAEDESSLSFFSVGESNLFFISVGLYGIISIIPCMALHIRRLHDINLSGGWLLLRFFLYLFNLNLLFELFLFCIKGTTGPNHYGEP